MPNEIILNKQILLTTFEKTSSEYEQIQKFCGQIYIIDNKIVEYIKKYEADMKTYGTKHYGFKEIEIKHIEYLEHIEINEYIKEIYNLIANSGTNVYVYGNVTNVILLINHLNLINNVILDKYLEQIIVVCDQNVLNEFNLSNNKLKTTLIDNLPINIFNVGIFIKDVFSTTDIFSTIVSEHKFQSLTESNKQSNAFRKGIYLTPIEKYDNLLKYKLLRCSSNLDGPTENFANIDVDIVSKVQNIANNYFSEKFELNHILAQIYNNFYSDNGKSCKAKIKAHSDKTKDMQENGIMAFCTFYDTKNFKSHNTKSNVFPNFNSYCEKNNLLTKIRFKLKSDVTNNLFVNTFDVTLYNNSVLLIPLETNRLYTHEIIPSVMPIENIPTRMGYVIRCSSTNAIYDLTNDKIYICYDSDTDIKTDTDTDTDIDQLSSLKQLKPITPDEIDYLKKMYYYENINSDKITYDKMYSSMNQGDYMKPNILF